MNLHQVRIFVSVAKHLNETKAATELHLSQSALSRHLTALQDQLGPLFNKNGRGLELSERGEAFYKRIQPILAELEAVAKEYGLKNVSEKPMTLKIGSSYGPATSLLPYVVNAFKHEYPTIEVHLRVLNSPDTQELIKNSALDLAVVTNPTPTDSVQMEPFKTFQICFFASSTHALATRKEISIEALARYPLVIGRAKKARSRTDELLSSMAANGVKFDVLMRCEWPDAVKSIVRQGEAVGLLYRDRRDL
jgi:DNA-binding transcriptional LysR family regulator